MTSPMSGIRKYSYIWRGLVRTRLPVSACRIACGSSLVSFNNPNTETSSSVKIGEQLINLLNRAVSSIQFNAPARAVVATTAIMYSQTDSMDTADALTRPPRFTILDCTQPVCSFNVLVPH